LFPNEKDRGRIQAQEVATLIKKEYTGLFQQVGEFLKKNYRAKHVLRQPVVAAMLDNFQRVPTIATQFWQPICDGLNLNEASDPRYQLKKYLENTALAMKTRDTSRVVGSEEMYNICIPVWNAWRKNEKRQTLRPSKVRVKSV
jgi:hypothetical protein